MSGLQIPIPHAVAAWSRKRRLHWIRLKRKHGFDPQPWKQGPWYVSELKFFPLTERRFVVPILYARVEGTLGYPLVSGIGEEHITSSPCSPLSVT